MLGTLIRHCALCLIWVNTCMFVLPKSKNLDSRLLLIRFRLKFLQANCEDPDHTPLTANCSLYETREIDRERDRQTEREIRSMFKFLQTNWKPWSDAALCVKSGSTLFACIQKFPNLGLHCLPVSRNLDSRLILVRYEYVEIFASKLWRCALIRCCALCLGHCALSLRSIKMHTHLRFLRVFFFCFLFFFVCRRLLLANDFKQEHMLFFN